LPGQSASPAHRLADRPHTNDEMFPALTHRANLRLLRPPVTIPPLQHASTTGGQIISGSGWIILPGTTMPIASTGISTAIRLGPSLGVTQSPTSSAPPATGWLPFLRPVRPSAGQISNLSPTQTMVQAPAWIKPTTSSPSRRMAPHRVALHCKGSTQTSVCYGKLDNRHFHVDF
jgi:hypothetical protein